MITDETLEIVCAWFEDEVGDTTGDVNDALSNGIITKQNIVDFLKDVAKVKGPLILRMLEIMNVE